MEDSVTQNEQSMCPHCLSDNFKSLQLGAAGVKLKVEIKGTIQMIVRARERAHPCCFSPAGTPPHTELLGLKAK